MYSLRRTLAVRFSLTMLAALMLIGMGAFFGVARTLNHLTNQGLISALELESDVLARGLSVARRAQSHDMISFVQSINRFVVVRDEAGNALVANTPLAHDLPLDSVMFQRALTGERAWSTDRWGGSRVRSVLAPVPPGSHPEFAVVQVSASLDPLARSGRMVLAFGVGIVLLATATTAVGAGWLAKSAVAPVEVITRHAGAINPGTPGKRISAHADTVEFHGLVAVLNSMLDRLDYALASQRRIIADVAHELRTPITAMQGELEIALRGERTPEEYRQVLRSCLEEAEHLNAIDETLLLLARLEAGEYDATPVPVDVCELVERAVVTVSGNNPSHQFAFASSPNAPSVPADAKLFKIVLDQLLENAVRHTPPGTKVRVTAGCSEDEFVLAIEDSGPGLPDHVLPHLFDRFWQADPARTRDGGIGLGLSVAAAVAEAHNGVIGASRSDLGGLKVELRLPLEIAQRSIHQKVSAAR